VGSHSSNIRKILNMHMIILAYTTFYIYGTDIFYIVNYSKLLVIWYPRILNTYPIGKHFKQNLPLIYRLKNESEICICSPVTSNATHHPPSHTLHSSRGRVDFWSCYKICFQNLSSINPLCCLQRLPHKNESENILFRLHHGNSFPYATGRFM
jgi:hypothetical protein